MAEPTTVLGTSLEPSEGSDDPSPPERPHGQAILTCCSRQALVHAKHARDRVRIHGALAAADDEALRKRADRLAFCCAGSTARAAADGRVFAALDRCRDRLCPLCARSRGIQVARDLAERCRRCDGARFLTLTLKARQEGLRETIRRLFECFNRWRRHAKIAPLIDGGVRALEITRGQENQAWHVHLHCIISGSFLAQRLASTLWFQVTGDSMIVDIRALHDRGEAAKYIAAYVAKPTRMDQWSPAQLREYAAGIHGVRLIQTWGSWTGAAVDSDDQPEPPVATSHLVRLNVVQALIEAGSTIAAAVRRRLCAHEVQWRKAFGFWMTPAEIDDAKPDELTLAKCFRAMAAMEHTDPSNFATFDRDYRGSGPLPQRSETQLVYGWMPQPEPDPHPAAVAQWDATEGLDQPWNT